MKFVATLKFEEKKRKEKGFHDVLKLLVYNENHVRFQIIIH